MAFMASTSPIADIRPQLPKRLDVLRAHHRSKQAQQPSVRTSEVAQETGLMRALHGAFLTALPMPPVVLAAAAAAAQSHVMEPSTNVRSITGPLSYASRAGITASRKRRSMSPAAAGALPPVPQSQPFVNSVSRPPQMNLQNLSALSSPAKRPQYESSQAPFPFAGPTCTDVPLNLHGCFVASGSCALTRLPPTVVPAARASSYDSHWYAPPPPLPPQSQSQIQLQPQPQPQHQPQAPSLGLSLHQPLPPALSQGIASSLPQALGSFCMEPAQPVFPLAPPLARAMLPPQSQSLAPQTTCLRSVAHLSQPQTQLQLQPQPQPQLLLQRQQQQLQQPPLQLVSPFAVPTQSIAFTSYSQADPSMTYFYPQ